MTYLEQFALLALEKQEKFAQLVGEHTMELDLDSGVARFSGAYEFPFQVLGTESDNTLTWLWAWADEQTEIASELLLSSRQMQEWGSRAGVPECTTPSVDLNRAGGHVLSMIASEVCRASCYYHEAYEGGGLFLLLFGQQIDGQAPFSADGLSRAFSQLLSVGEIDHRKAFLAYLRQKNLPVTEHASFIVSELESGEDIRANFNEAGRLVTLNGKTIEFT